MLLAIDIGNTHTVAGVYQGASLVGHFRLSTDSARTADEYAVLLRAMLDGAGIDATGLRAAVMASVVPPINATLAHMCSGHFGVQPLIIGPGVKTGMPIHYESPKDVGADRIVNGVAGFEHFKAQGGEPSGVIVVDFGTATTFDVVSPKGEYLGGAITPGLTISTDALFRRASKLPRVDLAMPETCLGKTTVHSMQAGIMFGAVATVDGIVTRLRSELDFDVRVVATGGAAELVAAQSTTVEHVDPLLTLTGLRLIHARNQGDTR